MTEKEQTAREAELARREAALAAREAQLEQEQAKLEAARAEAPKGRKTFLNNNDPDFVNPKEKLYDKFPLTVHQMDIIIGVLFALIVLFLVLGFTDPLILDMALHSLVEPVRDAEEKYIRLLADLVEKGSGAVQLTDNVRFCGREGLLWREESDNNIRPQGEKADVPERAVSLPEGGDYLLPGGGTLQIRVVSACFEEKTQGVHKKDLKNRADYARITTLYTGLVLRARQPGDRFRPAGRGLSKPLRKWMNEAGVPNELRDTLPLLASGSEILWVCGEGFADGLAPDTESRWILHLDAEIETQEEKTNEYAR